MRLRRQTVFEVQTPAWVFDPSILLKNVRAFERAVRDADLRGRVAYSVKTNSAPEVLSAILHSGVMAEVVSHDEWQFARLIGFPIQRIVYNGPMKSRESFQEAVIGGAVVNVECKRELDWLEELDSSLNEVETLKIGLRVNINVSKISPADAEKGDDVSRFGFSDETGELAVAIDRIRAMRRVRLAGLHLHRTTHSRRVGFYRALASYALELVKRYNLEDEIDWLDLGGGYYEMEPGKPTFGQYMRAVVCMLGDFGKRIEVIVEPGNALVANTVSYISEAIDIKDVEYGLRVVTTDATRTDLDPFFRRNDYIRDLHILNREASCSPIKKQVITGCTCIEQDCLFNLDNSTEILPGDRIVFRNVGAYTLTLAPQFIRFTPAFYIMERGYPVMSRPPMSAGRLLASLNLEGDK